MRLLPVRPKFWRTLKLYQEGMRRLGRRDVNGILYRHGLIVCLLCIVLRADGSVVEWWIVILVREARLRIDRLLWLRNRALLNYKLSA